MALEDWLKEGLSAARNLGAKAAEATKARASQAGLRGGSQPSAYDAQVRNWVANERQPLDKILAAERRAATAPTIKGAAPKTGLRGLTGRITGAAGKGLKAAGRLAGYAGAGYAGYEGAKATGLDTALAGAVPWVRSKFDDNPNNDYSYNTWRRLVKAGQDGRTFIPATANEAEVNAILDKRGLRTSPAALNPNVEATKAQGQAQREQIAANEEAQAAARAKWEEHMGLRGATPTPAPEQVDLPPGWAVEAKDGITSYADGKGNFMVGKGLREGGTFNVVPSSFFTNPDPGIRGELQRARIAAAKRGDYEALSRASMTPEERAAYDEQQALERDAAATPSLRQGLTDMLNTVSRRNHARRMLKAAAGKGGDTNKMLLDQYNKNREFNASQDERMTSNVRENAKLFSEDPEDQQRYISMMMQNGTPQSQQEFARRHEATLAMMDILENAHTGAFDWPDFLEYLPIVGSAFSDNPPDVAAADWEALGMGEGFFAGDDLFVKLPGGNYRIDTSGWGKDAKGKTLQMLRTYPKMSSGLAGM